MRGAQGIDLDHIKLPDPIMEQLNCLMRRVLELENKIIELEENKQ